MLVAKSGVDGAYVYGKHASKDEPYRCPRCEDLVVFHAGQQLAWHFKHWPESRCLYDGGGETEKHLFLKALAAREAKALGKTVLTEHSFGPRRADVYLPDDAVVIECQISDISENEVRDREADYERLGNRVIWLCEKDAVPYALKYKSNVYCVREGQIYGLHTGIPDRVRKVLLIRKEAGKTSTAKLKAMLEASGADGRLRGMFQYHGASTGRWAARRVQLHNLVRPKIKHSEIESALKTVRDAKDPEWAAKMLAMFYGPPLDILSWSLRAMLTAEPGKVLYAADFSNIEGRGLAWLAGEDWKLDAFRKYDAEEGPDLYLVAASRIYGKRPQEYNDDSPERQTGKTSELSLGYEGGLGAFRQMERNLGLNLKLTDDEVQKAKYAWRDAHPAITQFWSDLREAAIEAVIHPGVEYRAGAPGRQIKYKTAGSFLWCKLPSGRVLCYPHPSVKSKETPWGEMRDALHYMVVDGLTNKWVETSTYGGSQSADVTQGFCRDLLADGMLAVEDKGYPVVLHVHDEAVAETPENFGNLDEYISTFAGVAKKYEGLPVTSKGWRGERFRKG